MNRAFRPAVLCLVLSATFLIVSCGGGSSSSSGDGVILAVNHYFQGDPDWRSDFIGNSSSQIFENGSMLTSLAMMMSSVDPAVDPGTLNIWMTNNGGYFQSELTMFFSALNDHPTAPFDHVGGGAYALTTLKVKIDAGIPVPVRVNSSNGFVLMFGYENEGTTTADFLYYNPADMTGTAFGFDTALTPDVMVLFE